MTVSRLDQLYRRLLLTKFFTRGWGKPDNLKRLFAFRKILSNRDSCQYLVPADYPINIDKEYKDGDCIILEGHFTSPFIHHLPGIMPKEVETASFQMILPHQWRDSKLKPVCIHLAGTGDHFFWRRRILTARPLLKESGIASILLENPYYGTRKPKQQLRSSLHNVSDLFVMGGALVLESLALLHWCERQGWGPLGLSGISMGGHMASLAATNWTKPISLVPCLSWSTASCVFTQGVMSGAIPWKTLQEQFFENSVYQDEIRKLIISPEDKHRAYAMGQQFVKDYSHNILQVESMHEQLKTKESAIVPTLEESHRTSFSAETPNRCKPNFTTEDVSSHPEPQVDSSKMSTAANNSFKYGVIENQIDIGLNVLTCEEYITRVQKEQSTKHEQSSSINSPSGEPHENVRTTVSSGNPVSALNNFSVSSTSSLNLFSSSSHTVSSTSPLQTTSSSASAQQQHHSCQPQAAENQQPFSLSSQIDSSVTVNEKRSNQVETQARKLADVTYSKNSQIQQKSKIHSVAETSSLALKDALSKSRLMISHLSQSALPTKEEQMKDLQHEALDFMRGVMDECTHLGNFSVPVDPELVIIVSAKQDAYVPKEGVIGLDQLWPGCEVRYVDQGHVGAVLFNQAFFRKAVSDAFDRQIKKYHLNPVSPDVQHTAQSSS